MSSYLTAFSNPIRLKIVVCLRNGQKNVSQLVSVCGISQSAVSQHLTLLKEDGVLVSVRKGKEIYYSLSKQEIGDVAEGVYKLTGGKI